ncbi:MAG: C4-type zinc ribbon domain-containing protein, partial [bacterium]|nr:C4-type zinc ribbon domain-containing protein [bacterium]
SIKKNEARLYEIKNNKEYQASLREIAQIKKTVRDLENEILALMEQVELGAKAVGELVEIGKEKEGNIQKQIEELKKEEAEQSQQCQEKESAREQALAGLESSVLGQYERVKRVREDAVAVVKGGNCLGCHMRLPPQLFNQILRKEKIHLCPNCHRMLYLEEEEATEGKEQTS